MEQIVFTAFFRHKTIKLQVRTCVDRTMIQIQIIVYHCRDRKAASLLGWKLGNFSTHQKTIFMHLFWQKCKVGPNFAFWKNRTHRIQKSISWKFCVSRFTKATLILWMYLLKYQVCDIPMLNSKIQNPARFWRNLRFWVFCNRQSV